MSSLNYYEILELPRTATHEQIGHAFRRLSQKYNPNSNITQQAANQVKFDLICEAFEVLNHQERKATFDKYGEYGLKNGVQSIKPYVFMGNSM